MGFIPAGVPQGTKFLPWLFLTMINDLNAREADMWKYVDDTTISEAVDKGQESCIQQVVDDLARQERDRLILDFLCLPGLEDKEN